MRTAKLVGCFVASILCLGTLEAQAHNVFKKALESKLGMKVDCNACHVDKKPKTERSAFGILFYKEFEAEELTKNWKTKKGADKKDYEEKVMVPAFEKATEKVLAMKLEDLIKAGLFDGIKSPAEQTDSAAAVSHPKQIGLSSQLRMPRFANLWTPAVSSVQFESIGPWRQDTVQQPFQPLGIQD